MTIGQKITRLRKEDNLTQEQLADILHVSRQSVSKWESNLSYPETEKLIQLSKLFNCSIDYLLNNEVEIKDSLSNNSTVSKKKKKITINKRGLPLAIATMAIAVLALIFYVSSTFDISYYSYYQINPSYYYTINLTVNFYEVCFGIFSFTDNPFFTFIYLITFILTISTFILGCFYMFFSKKALYISVKIVTVLMAICYAISLFSTINTAVQYLVYVVIIAIYAIVMLIIKPFRFKIDKETIK